MSLERLRASLSDRYRIERELGQGGMATVYLAEDLKHKRQVAIKVLKPELAAVLGAERFVQEITTTAALQHPHILPLFDSGTADGFLYYVMPFIQGETLRTKLDRETQLGIDEAVRITTAVADALDYAHRQGVIHRDIKPENILLHEGRPMVADFGIALAVSAAAGGRMTETGLSLGTPHYMSPEQATAEKEITARSDMYSLGSVLYEMLTGNPPHTGASAQQIIMKIVTEDAVPVSRIRKSVPPNVAAAVAQALEKLPADRFGSAAEFAEALGNPVFAARRMGGEGGSALRSRRTSAFLAGAAVIASVLALWGWLRPFPNPGSDPVMLQFLPPPDSALVTRDRLAALALSPDGSLLAYSSFLGGTRKILLRRMDDGRVTVLAGAGAPSFSPDGRWLVDIGGEGIFRAPVTGGAPVRVGGPGFMGGTWSDDGWIYQTTFDYGLRRTPEGGGAPQVVVPRRDGEARGPWHAAALPGGNGVIFRRCTTNQSSSCRLGAWREDRGVTDLDIEGLAGWYLPTGHLFYVRPDGAGLVVPFDLRALKVRGDPVPVLDNISLTPDDAPNLAWSPSGTLAFVRGDQGESGTLAHLNDRGETTVMATRAGFYRNPRVSPDGELVAFLSFPAGLGRSAQLWLVSRRSGTMRPLETEQRVAAVAWSPDGSELGILAGGLPGAEDVRWRLYRLRVDGRDSLRSVPMGGDTLSGSSGLEWTPDGRWLVATSVRGGRGGVVAIAADGSGEARAVVRTAASARAGAVSPDGRWIAYLSNETGVELVSVRSLWGEGSPVTVSLGPSGSAPHWRRDSRALYFADADTLRMVEIEYTPDPKVTARQSLPVLTEAMSGVCECFAPDRSGNGFVVLQRTVPNAVLTVVLNWFTDIRRRVAQAGP